MSLDDLGVPGDPVEDGETFETNAAIKARFAAVAATGLPTLADDSGLEVDALDGGPGVRTRRYAGEDATDADNNAKLLAALDGLPPERRGARYVCVLALALPGDRARAAASRSRSPAATCRGRIAHGAARDGRVRLRPDLRAGVGSRPAAGRSGLWTPAEKHAISHRARAARRMAPHAGRARVLGRRDGGVARICVFCGASPGTTRPSWPRPEPSGRGSPSEASASSTAAAGSG